MSTRLESEIGQMRWFEYKNIDKFATFLPFQPISIRGVETLKSPPNLSTIVYQCRPCSGESAKMVKTGFPNPQISEIQPLEQLIMPYQFRNILVAFNGPTLVKPGEYGICTQDNPCIGLVLKPAFYFEGFGVAVYDGDLKYDGDYAGHVVSSVVGQPYLDSPRYHASRFEPGSEFSNLQGEDHISAFLIIRKIPETLIPPVDPGSHICLLQRISVTDYLYVTG